MTRSTAARSLIKATFFTLLGTVVMVVLLPALFAQDAGKKDGDKAAVQKEGAEKPPVVKPAGGKAVEEVKPEALEGYKLHSIVRMGFTRPGNPPDTKTKEGTIKRAAFEPDFKGIGGTVYFMVLEQTGNEGDSWGTGLRNFNSTFVQGLDIDNTYSPRLNNSDKYLYLFQIVNDRGMDPIPVRGAANKEFGTEPVASVTLRLRVDPRYIRSWGHFRTAGFTLSAVDRKLNGEVLVDAKGREVNRIMAVSATPPIISVIPEDEQLYKLPAPAYRMPEPLGIGLATLNLNDSFAVADLRKKKEGKIAIASWGNQLLRAAESAIEPSLVELSYVRPGYWDRVLSVGEKEARPDQAAAAGVGGEAAADGMREIVFRAEWRGDKLVKMGQHSVLFGFTTDLPPMDEPVAIADARATAAGGEGIRAAAVEPGAAVGAGVGVAPGTAPSPSPPAPGGGFGGLAGGRVGAIGGFPAPFGGGGFPGFGGGLGGGVGAGTTPAAATTGGGGSGNGNGNGTPSTATSTTPANSNSAGHNRQLLASALLAEAQAAANARTGPVTVTVNVRQNQHQSQHQRQQQGEHEGGGGHHHGHVVPEPAAVVLGLLGLPFLIWLCWRRQKSSPLAVAGGPDERLVSVS